MDNFWLEDKKPGILELYMLGNAEKPLAYFNDRTFALFIMKKLNNCETFRKEWFDIHVNRQKKEYALKKLYKK